MDYGKTPSWYSPQVCTIRFLFLIFSLCANSLQTFTTRKRNLSFCSQGGLSIRPPCRQAPWMQTPLDAYPPDADPPIYRPPLDADPPTNADTPPPPPRYMGYYGIRSTSGRYASYWNAFLFCKVLKHKNLKYMWFFILLKQDFCNSNQSEGE